MSIAETSWGKQRIAWGKQTYLMGIVNITPDSFSGDGLLALNVSEEALMQRAIEQARRFVEEGARFIDVGGESTRPHAEAISVEKELARVIPVIRALKEILPEESIISIDTYKAEVAEEAIQAGASLLNDIWGAQKDPRIAEVARKYRVPIVLMANMRETPQEQRHEIVSDTIRYLARSIDLALAAGVAWEHIIIDPGIGFGIAAEESLTLLSRLHELKVLGRPLLLGVSRKSHIGRVLGGLPASERLEGTAASVALGIAQGADIVRVHDVWQMARVVKMSDAIVRGSYSF